MYVSMEVNLDTSNIYKITLLKVAKLLARNDYLSYFFMQKALILSHVHNNYHVLLK